VFGAEVRRVVCPVGYLEPSIRSNMEQASVFVLHLHSSGIGGIRARQRRRVTCTHQKSGHCQLLHYVSVGILWYPLSLSRRLSHSTESVSLYLQSLSLMLYTSFGVARCLQSSGLTAGSPAAAASSLDMFGRSHGIVL
jgi:hypothetical protein